MNTSSQMPNDNRTGSDYGVGSFLLELSKLFLVVAIIVAPIRIFLFSPFFVKGASMEPNFHDGQYLIINEFGYKQTDVLSLFTVKPSKELERGDVVVFHSPYSSDFFIKRVIALPGESIEITHGEVFIKKPADQKMHIFDESSYLDVGIKTQGEIQATLGEKEYFLMGDNRWNSKDSRSFGPVSADKVIGKVALRAFPFTDFTTF